MAQTGLMHVSPRVADKFERMAGTIRRMREENKSAIARTERTVAVAVTGAGLGYLEGRYDRTEIAGAPIAATIGVLATVAGYAMGGESAEPLFAVGDGALGVASFKFMKDVGVEHKNKANNTTTTTAGVTPFRRAA